MKQSQPFRGRSSSIRFPAKTAQSQVGSSSNSSTRRPGGSICRRRSNWIGISSMPGPRFRLFTPTKAGMRTPRPRPQRPSDCRRVCPSHAASRRMPSRTPARAARVTVPRGRSGLRLPQLDGRPSRGRGLSAASVTMTAPSSGWRKATSSGIAGCRISALCGRSSRCMATRALMTCCTAWASRGRSGRIFRPYCSSRSAACHEPRLNGPDPFPRSTLDLPVREHPLRNARDDGRKAHAVRQDQSPHKATKLSSLVVEHERHVDGA
jgi:hypothetical protein